MGDEIEKYNVKIKGTRPLLMNSCRSMVEDKLGTPIRAKKEITLEEEAQRVLYIDEKENPIVPAFCVLSCLRKSAVNFKVPGKGKKTYKDFIYSGIQIEPEDIPVISNDGWEVDLKPVVIGRARVIKARPKFKQWELEFQAKIIDPIITPPYLKEIIISAGKYSGLLDFRPLYGLFEVVEFEKVE
jgi:hypothetical protein